MPEVLYIRHLMTELLQNLLISLKNRFDGPKAIKEKK
jgi:hypothetical protein